MTQDDAVRTLERQRFRVTSTLSTGEVVMSRRDGPVREYAQVDEDGFVNGEELTKYLTGLGDGRRFGMRRTAGFEKHLDERMEGLGFDQSQYEIEGGLRPSMRMTDVGMGPSALGDLASRLRPDFNAHVRGDTLFFMPVSNLWSRTGSERTAGVDEKVNELMSALDEVNDAILEAGRKAKDAERLALAIGGEVGRVVGGQLELYLGRTLASFRSNVHQPGSIASLTGFMDGWYQEQKEQESEGGEA
jgi:hypothetical protein